VFIRERYLERLRRLKDVDLIKIVTGVRRSGKSTLLRQFRDELLKMGIPNERIISYNFDFPKEIGQNLNYFDIYSKIESQLSSPKMHYVFLDEVQLLPEFERLARGLYNLDNVDLYITGSVGSLLSGELATLLTGRYVLLEVFPFSFKEFAIAKPEFTKENAFQQYVDKGGFPLVVTGNSIESFDVVDYLRAVYAGIVLNDAMVKGGVNDREMLEHISEFLLENAGNFVSPKKITDYVKSNYRGIAPLTVDKILTALTDCFLFYKLNRFDIKGKFFLQTLQKYYAVDPGFRTAVLGKDLSLDRGRNLENIVCIELLRRYSKVWIGELNWKEIDFVVQDRDGKGYAYYQVCESMLGEEIRKRELAPLLSIRDHFPKYVLTLDYAWGSQDGVQVINLIDWLLEDVD
jgi:predicted AAA+ superfamily ATPase